MTCWEGVGKQGFVHIIIKMKITEVHDDIKMAIQKRGGKTFTCHCDRQLVAGLGNHWATPLVLADPVAVY